METGRPGGLEAKRREIRRYWDAHPIATDSVPQARGTPESFEAIYGHWMQDVAEPLRFAERSRGERVLEIGCGIGIFGRFLLERGCDYHGVDLSAGSLDLARKQLRLRSLPQPLVHADAARLPFRDGAFGVVFSLGVLHHVPELARACREAVRVTRPGGTLRVMFYHRHSYHSALVNWVVRPLLWLLLHLPGGGLAHRVPRKLREMYEICRDHGFDRQRILDISTDTSTAGDANFNPFSLLVSEAELLALFPGLEGCVFERSGLKYYPLPFLRGAVERRFGFFLTLTARKPAG